MDMIKFLAGMLILILCFMVGRWAGHMDYHEKLILAQRELQICNQIWEADSNLCKPICAEEFEKMGC